MWERKRERARERESERMRAREFVRACVRSCHLKPYLKFRSKCKKYSNSAKPEVCNVDINKDAFSKMVEESLLYVNSVEALWSKCEFKDSTFRTWKKRTPNVWPKEARGKWLVADLHAIRVGKPVCHT